MQPSQYERITSPDLYADLEDQDVICEMIELNASMKLTMKESYETARKIVEQRRFEY